MTVLLSRSRGRLGRAVLPEFYPPVTTIGGSLLPNFIMTTFLSGCCAAVLSACNDDGRILLLS